MSRFVPENTAAIQVADRFHDGRFVRIAAICLMGTASVVTIGLWWIGFSHPNIGLEQGNMKASTYHIKGIFDLCLFATIIGLIIITWKSSEKNLIYSKKSVLNMFNINWLLASNEAGRFATTSSVLNGITSSLAILVTLAVWCWFMRLILTQPLPKDVK